MERSRLKSCTFDGFKRMPFCLRCNSPFRHGYVLHVQTAKLSPAKSRITSSCLGLQQLNRDDSEKVRRPSPGACTLIDLAKRVVSHGEPIIRPMWYAAPDDARTFTISNQFMFGDDIMVAPVLEQGHRERNVYFPHGTWIDQHGKQFTGPSVAKVLAPLEELPYFKRKY